MPPVIPIEGVIRCAYQWKNASGVNVVNIFHVGTITRVPSTLADFNLLVTSMTNISSPFFLNWYSQMVASDIVLELATFRNLGAAADLKEVVMSHGGTATAASFNPQATWCLSWKASNIGWRGGRPKTYMPGLPTTAVQGANTSGLDPTWRTQSTSKATQMMNAVSGAGTSVPYDMGFVSYTTTPVGGSSPIKRDPPLWFPFNNVEVHGRIDTQRRRLGKEINFP